MSIFFVVLWLLFKGDIHPPSNPPPSVEGVGRGPTVPLTEFNNVDINNNVMNGDEGGPSLLLL